MHEQHTILLSPVILDSSMASEWPVIKTPSAGTWDINRVINMKKKIQIPHKQTEIHTNSPDLLF